MSRNIKEIGKELMGKSLNSFHRKTGLTQLEKNNEMQDGILDGILSQVDDAYIEKTEQSNVIHLDGSGDGVVVLDSVEGNTMVNRMPKFNGIYTTTSEVIVPSFEAKYSRFGNSHCLDVTNMPRNITIISLGKGIGVEWLSDNENGNGVSWKGVISTNQTIKHTILDNRCTSLSFKLPLSNGYTSNDVKNIQILILEGDWTNREIPQYFEGLQSSFEEKVNDEGKYEIEILSHNKNLFDITKTIYGKYVDHNLSDGTFGIVTNSQYKITDFIKVESGKTYFNNVGSGAFYTKDKKVIKTSVAHENIFTVPSNAYYVVLTSGINTDWSKGIIQLNSINDKSYIPYKSNKIKLLINEPLRAVGNSKDILCIKDNKLMIKRNVYETNLNGSNSEQWRASANNPNITNGVYIYYYNNILNHIEMTPKLKGNVICNSLSKEGEIIPINPIGICLGSNTPEFRISIPTVSSNVDLCKKWLQQNPLKIVYELAEPIYEEVLNEYGEPIILEGYENGTIYIDSTIVPTTTVRYTPKMESFKTLKEVNNNNIMLTNDVNDNIIPYMMDVDLMIMEKEMALPSKANIRRIGAKDMTSMQKRTQDMLERLIKGKTLTEQECKTRVTTYLNAGKITDAQAEELNFLIDEIYA